VEAGLGVLTFAQSSSGAQLRLSDGRVFEVSVGSFTVKSNPGQAVDRPRRLVELIVLERARILNPRAIDESSIQPR
jgi:hypothetical protein